MLFHSGSVFSALPAPQKTAGQIEKKLWEEVQQQIL
jgi:hypothetical protein